MKVNVTQFLKIFNERKKPYNSKIYVKLFSYQKETPLEMFI